MKTFFLTLFLLSYFGGAACSGYEKSFCYVKSTRQGHHVISGVITAKAGHSVELKVLDVFAGVETRSVITIWDGKDYDCNGNVSMKAGDMGGVNDTIIAILPQISGVPQNTWEVTGDYGRPISLYETAWLTVENDSVRGFIAGSVFAPPTMVMKYGYSAFKSYWQSHSNDCVTLDLRDAAGDELQVLVTNDLISIQTASGSKRTVKIYTIEGRLLTESLMNEQLTLDCSHLPGGVYLIVLEGNGERQRQKFVLQ